MDGPNMAKSERGIGDDAASATATGWRIDAEDFVPARRQRQYFFSGFARGTQAGDRIDDEVVRIRVEDNLTSRSKESFLRCGMRIS